MKNQENKQTEKVEFNSIGKKHDILVGTTTTLEADYPMLKYINLADEGYEIESEIFQFDKELHKPTSKVVLSDIYDIQQLLRQNFGNIKGLRDVYILEKGKETQVWLILSVEDDDLRNSIYDIQYLLLTEHPYLQLDFYVVALEDRTLKSMVPTNAMRLTLG